MDRITPRPWKTAPLSFLCIYPLINLISFTLMPWIGRWPIPLRTLLVCLILVPLMGLLIGILQRRFQAWLHR